MGVAPEALTLRELLWMHQGRQEAQWDRTAAVLALTASIHRDVNKRKKPYLPSDFHPYRKAVKKVASKDDLQMLREKLKLMRTP